VIVTRQRLRVVFEQLKRCQKPLIINLVADGTGDRTTECGQQRAMEFSRLDACRAKSAA
jgi:hypothetical protein